MLPYMAYIHGSYGFIKVYVVLLNRYMYVIVCIYIYEISQPREYDCYVLLILISCIHHKQYIWIYPMILAYQQAMNHMIRCQCHQLLFMGTSWDFMGMSWSGNSPSFVGTFLWHRMNGIGWTSSQPFYGWGIIYRYKK